MAKVYRVVKMVQDTEDTFRVVETTDWGTEIGKARSRMNEMLDTLPDLHVVGLMAMDAPATREEFVAWLNKHAKSSKSLQPGSGWDFGSAKIGQELAAPLECLYTPED